jgi:hypothetical protein
MLSVACPQIVKCCQHFEAKCAGKYDKGSLGARLLFDLSREIQDLAQSLVQHDSDRDTRIRHLEVRHAHAVEAGGWWRVAGGLCGL